jgi:alpha-L-fucosidase
MPAKKSASFMEDYKVAKLVVPKKDTAYIETFFTQKENTLYCTVPNYSNEIILRDIPYTSNSKLSILGTATTLNWKKIGKDIKVDLTSLHPGDVHASGIFVIKITDTQ